MLRSHYALPGVALLIALASCSEPTTPEPDKSQAAAPELATTAGALSFYQLSAGSFRTCGLTADQRAYCWGQGLLGDGRDYRGPASSRPVAVSGGLRFIQISASGLYHVCGVTTDYRAYCWGFAGGALGNGDYYYTDATTPVPVSGGLRFYHVDGGGHHTCGLSYPDKLAYCWGTSEYGELGNGKQYGSSSTPVAVAGRRQFRQVSAGFNHNCGLTPTGPVYCWGDNRYGQTGDGDLSTAKMHLTPVLVAGGKSYIQLDAGRDHTCAVGTDHRAYCWGNGRSGQVGDGRTILRFAPRAVAGGLSFDRVSADWSHTCGETTGNRAYCWGDNSYGNLGDGTTTRRVTPVAVAGGLFFSQVTTGLGTTCGRTDAGVGYCWGDNRYGQLGDGTTTNRSRPTRIVGPS